MKGGLTSTASNKHFQMSVDNFGGGGEMLRLLQLLFLRYSALNSVSVACTFGAAIWRITTNKS